MSNSPFNLLGGALREGAIAALGSKVRARRSERAGLSQEPAVAASVRVAPTQPLAKPVGIAPTPINPVRPTVTNNSVNNTLAAAPTVSTASLDPISRQPMGGVQSVPNIQEQTTPEDIATYGVAGAAESMFGTPMQRQMSMGMPLMKRAFKYKNK